jgi:hypothetical protein
MGKKIGLGCLVIGLAVLIGGGYFAYTSFVKPLMSSVTVLEDIDQTNSQINDQSSYTPPQSGELTENQVERFVEAQREIRQGLETRLAEFQQKYEELNAELENRQPTFNEITGAWSDMIQMYADAKQIQVEALNSHDFSLQEYRFVQQSFYQALGVELFTYNIDQIAASAKEGNFNMDMSEYENLQEQMNEVPEKNRELVSPYAEDAESWITFAWWGL